MRRIATISPVFGCSVEDLRALAREAEDAGFEAIYSPEVQPWSAIANAQVFAEATSNIKVGTWIANIYMRHPVVAAGGALTVQEVSGGRMVLGLGVSHKPINDKFGVNMGNLIEEMRKYVTTIRSFIDGSSELLRLKRDLPPVPIYIAGLTQKTCELAGEVSDGIMAYIATPSYVKKMVEAVKTGAEKAGRFANEIDITNGLPTFISEDTESAYDAAKKGLGMYATFPFYQRMIKNVGYPEIIEKIKDGVNPAEALTNEFLDEVALIGPPSRCREKLDAFIDAGLRLPIIVPNPVGKQSNVEVMKNVTGTFKE
ncbi:MAG: LLM class flavin-dependent oxidoreductase [Candidatus Dadabacteria bacterium]|nr:LLM class flavin-dependent oxidoreductase [Candidatus Dadabacteria bacterium]